MSVFNGTVYSTSLRMMTSLVVSMPSGGKRAYDAQDVPVIYLLHGLSDNHSAWLRRTNIDRYAEEAGIAVVMPEVQRSFYMDMKYGMKYFSYIADELPRICRSMFRVSERREDNFVAGLSMGGYGAMKMALRRPAQYCAAASFSGAVDLERRMNGADDLMTRQELFALVGGELSDEDNLFTLASDISAADCPDLYLTCGHDDFLLEDNRNFIKHLNERGITHKYEEWAGGHEWTFWDESVRRAIAAFADRTLKD